MPHVANPALDSLIHQVEAAIAVDDSVITFFDGLPDLFAVAIKKAIGLGATEAELAPMQDLSDTLKARGDKVAAAVVANTPVAPTPTV